MAENTTKVIQLLEQQYSWHLYVTQLLSLSHPSFDIAQVSFLQIQFDPLESKKQVFIFYFNVVRKPFI